MDEETNHPQGEGSGQQTEQNQDQQQQQQQADQAPPKEEKPTTVQDDPILSVIAQDLGIAVDGKPIEKAPEQKPEEKQQKPVEAQQTKPKPEQTPTPEEQKPVEVVKKRTIEEIVEAGVDKVLEERARAQTGQQPSQPSREASEKPKAKEEQKPDEFEGWSEDEKREHEIAVAAERLMPAKYKGMASKIVEFKKKVEDFTAKALSDDPDRVLDENDEEFMSFIEESKPKYDASDRRSIEHRMQVDAAAEEAERRVSAKLNEQERMIRELREKPEIESTVSRFEKDIVEALAAEDKEVPEVSTIGAKAKEIGLKQVAEQLPIVGKIMSDTVSAATRIANTYMRISKRVVDFNPDNEEHVWIAKFIMEQGRAFAARGGELRVRVSPDGRRTTFMPRAEYADMCANNPAQAANFWTFNDRDVLAMLAANAGSHIKQQTKSVIEALRAEGYVRKQPGPGSQQPDNSPQPQQQPDKKNPKSPSVVPSPSPGASSAGGVSQQGAMSREELEALGIPIKS